MITRLLQYSCRIESVANLREHWARKAKRVKLHRQLAWAVLSNCAPLTARGNAVACTVTLTRIAPRQLDGDNLQVAFKATRDQVAEWLTMDDNDVRITWRYAQEKGEPKQYGVRIHIAVTPS